MEPEFDTIVARLKSHFSPQELVEFLGVTFDQLLSEDMLDLIETQLDEVKEELGLET